MNLNLLYVHTSSMGYGRLGSYLADTLRKRGIEIYDWLPRPDAYEPDEKNVDKNPGRSNLACWVSTPSHADGWWKGQHTALFTMWEATRLPEGFLETLHDFDTLVVPSPQNVELFSQHHPNVHLATLGVDTDRWQYRGRLHTEDEFRFLIGGSGKRKGTDLAFKAFMTLWGKEGSWGSGPVPKLLMKSPKGEEFFDPAGRVQTVAGRLSAEEETDLYAYAHCYLQPSRGEGFGLQPLQAIAQGCPTILTFAHGHESFADLGLGISATLAPSDYFIFGDAGEWWEPNFDELVDAMRDVYTNYETYREQAVESSRVAHRFFSWDDCADQFLAAFDPDLFSDYTGPDEWVKPEQQLYRVRVNNPRKMDIANYAYVMTPGEDYWVTADVKRILFENGNLDPDCIGEAEGLTEAQLTKFGLYPAKYGSCPTCNRPLNR